MTPYRPPCPSLPHPWHIHSDGGLLGLVFLPESMRREDKNRWLAARRYVQPIGLFTPMMFAFPDAV